MFAPSRALLLCALLAPCACASAPSTPDAPFVPTATAAPRGSASAQGDRDGDEADPAAQRLLRERLEQPAVALAVVKEPPRVPKIALDNSALDHARDMPADPEVLMARLTEGQRGSIAVSVVAGECTTFVAQGGLGVIEVDVFLTTGSGSDVRVLAEDGISGPIAALGGRGRCFENASATALSAELHVIVRRGAGAVLVGRYRRARR